MASIVGSLGGMGLGAAIGTALFPGVGTILGSLTSAAIGSAVGGAVGGAIGSYVDQAFLFPAIFGSEKQSIQNAKIDDFQFTTASPGSPVNWCLGRYNRLGGTLMWISPVRAVKHEEDVGGGGKTGGGQSVTSYEYFVSFAVLICEGPVSRVTKMWADGNVIWKAEASPAGANPDDRFKSVTFYDGATDQNPDPIIESYQGAGNVPGFRGLCYVVIEDLALGQFGQRIPNLNFLVEARSQTLLSEAVEEIWARSGRDAAADLDTRWLRGVEVVGYNVVGPQNVSKQLEPLLLAYNVVAQEVSGRVMLKRRQDFTAYPLPQSVLAAREPGQDNARYVGFTDKAGFDLPSEVNVQYIDYNFGFQKSSQKERMRNAPSPTVLSLDVPMCMSGDEAKTLARRVLWSAWAERVDGETSLPPSVGMGVLESDLLSMGVDSETYPMRVTSVSRGSNYLFEIKAVSEQAHVLTVTATADPVVYEEQTPGGTPVPVFIPMDIPLLPDKPSERIMYAAVALDDPNSTWRGARVQNGPAPTGPWFGWLDFSAESNAGYTLDALPANPKLDQWDRVTTLDVVMYEGQPETKTEAEVLAGANRAYVGNGLGVGEVIQFCNASLIATDTYRLSKLLRGRRDTWDRAGAHAPGDLFVILDELVKGKTYGEDQHLQPRYFGAVPKGANQTIDDVTKVGPVVRTSRSLRPFTPAYLRGSRDVSNNLTVSWLRSSRKYFLLFSQEAPDDAPSEKYDVELSLPSDSGPRRTVTVSGDSSYVYTASAQSADGVTPGAAVKVVVYKLNSDMDSPGRGNPATATV